MSGVRKSLPLRKSRKTGLPPGLSIHRRLPAPHKFSYERCSRVVDGIRAALDAAVILAERHREPRVVAALAMAFSHINLDARSSPPGPDDPCPCASGKKTARCCTVDHWRFIPLRGRRRGAVPTDLAEQVDQLATAFRVRFLAKTFLPARLAGLAPCLLTEDERRELRELFTENADQVDEAPALLQQLGYGKPRGRRPRAQRAHGQKRGQRLDGLVGKLPRALAKRLPTSADTHRHGRNDAQDIYGPCSAR